MELDKDDFVLYNENNRIKSGGYSVNSILLNKNNPAFTTYNKQNGGGAEARGCGPLVPRSKGYPLLYVISELRSYESDRKFWHYDNFELT